MLANGNGKIAPIKCVKLDTVSPAAIQRTVSRLRNPAIAKMYLNNVTGIDLTYGSSF